MNTADIRDRIPRFRILVIGRANAGKTTILQKVCKTTENPEIYDGAEHKIDAAILESSKERGNHQIENEMVFPSNPGFVFHDSCGFEAGGEDEFEIAKRFISERADERRLEKRLHAIWYCIPMDEHSRAFTEAEAKFFDNCNPGSVPVIMVFTKFDALHNVAFSRVPRALPRQERLRQVSQLAESLFAETKIVDRLLARKYPPRCHVCLQDLHKLSADCNVLLESTAATLDDEVLKQLLVSTQQTNLELCIKYAVDDTLMKSVDRTHHPWTKLNPVELGEQLAVWFPQYTIWYYKYKYYWWEYMWKKEQEYLLEYEKKLEQKRRLFPIRQPKMEDALKDTIEHVLVPFIDGFNSALEKVLHFGIAIIIILEYSAVTLQQDRSIKDHIAYAAKHYLESPTVEAVKKDMEKVVEKARKGRGERNRKELEDMIIKVILENRLSKI